MACLFQKKFQRQLLLAKNFNLFLALIPLCSISCLGQGKDTSTVEKIQINIDTLKPTLPIIKDEYHIYEGQQLRRIQYNSYLYKNEEKKIEIREEIPGVLAYYSRGGKGASLPYTAFRLDFYDSNLEKIKSINLINESPYHASNKQEIILGSPDFEYLKLTQGESIREESLRPSPFYTFNESLFSNSGYTSVCFYLYKVSANKLTEIETTIKVYSRQGMEALSLTVPYEVKNPYVSKDGNILIFAHGSEESVNPMENVQPTIELFDVVAQKSIYREKFDSRVVMSKLLSTERDDLYVLELSESLNRDKLDKLLLIDLKSRMIHFRAGDRELTNELFNPKNFTNYSNLLSKINFNSKAF